MAAKNRPENIRLTSKDIAAYCQVSKSTVLEWIKSKGGLAGMEKINEAKKNLLYSAIDAAPDFFKGTAELSLDNNNRFLIPKRLLDLAGIERDVVMAGQDGRIEIWSSDAYSKIDMQSGDFADLADGVVELFDTK